VSKGPRSSPSLDSGRRHGIFSKPGGNNKQKQQGERNKGVTNLENQDQGVTTQRWKIWLVVGWIGAMMFIFFASLV
jgi:hypothetical protein